MPSVSAALIVRNEERFLEGCLASIAGIVDEIVVVDTGSTDTTIDIAKSFGVTLLHRQWRDDFAWARNESLAAASGAWILYIDADERLTLPPGRRLADSLDQPDAIAARVVFYPRVNVTPYREYRLFRNDPEIRFRGTMHETMVPDLQRLQSERGGVFIDSAAEIRHLGYEGDQAHKYARNIPLLRAALQVRPDRLYYWHDLVRSLAGSGKVDEALAVAAEGYRQVRPEGMSAADRAVATLLIGTYARLLFSRGEGDRAMELIESGLALYPGQPQLRLLKARALVERGAFEEALVIATELAAIDGAAYFDPHISHSRRLFDVHAPDLMGIILLRLGRRAEAADAFERAAQAAPDDPSYRVKAIAIRGASARSPGQTASE